MVQLLNCFHKWHKVKFFPHTPALPSSDECQWMPTAQHKHTQPHPILLKPIHSPTGADIVIYRDKLVEHKLPAFHHKQYPHRTTLIPPHTHTHTHYTPVTA